MPYRLRYAAALLLILIALRPLAARATQPESTPPNKRGVHLMLDDGRNEWPVARWRKHMTLAREAVGPWGYVTQVIRVDSLDVAHWQVFMDLCAELELTPILRLATTYDHPAQRWRAPPRDAGGGYTVIAAAYARFVAALLWPTDTPYVIVGNEPNHGAEWGGQPDPGAYARFLIDVATALHARDPAVVVMNAGLDHYAPHTGDVPLADGSRFMDAESFVTTLPAKAGSFSGYARRNRPR